MLMIEAPPGLKASELELPRIVDRMDDVLEPARRDEASGSASPRGGPMALDDNEEEAVETDDDQVKEELAIKVKQGRKRTAAVKPRKVGGARAPQVPVYRYPAVSPSSESERLRPARNQAVSANRPFCSLIVSQGKMTAEEFIGAADTFHLVIEQEGSAGRIERALLEFDIKPRKFSTGYAPCHTSRAKGSCMTADSGIIDRMDGVEPSKVLFRRTRGTSISG